MGRGPGPAFLRQAHACVRAPRCWKAGWRWGILRLAAIVLHSPRRRIEPVRSPAENPPEDPLVRSARREAAIAFGMWLAAMLYSVTYCYLNGYGRSAESLSFVLWFPDWVFWGVVVPWGLCVLASTVFAFRIMGDEPLGEAIDSQPPAVSDSDREVDDA